MKDSFDEDPFLNLQSSFPIFCKVDLKGNKVDSTKCKYFLNIVYTILPAYRLEFNAINSIPFVDSDLLRLIKKGSKTEMFGLLSIDQSRKIYLYKSTEQSNVAIKSMGLYILLIKLVLYRFSLQ